MPPALERPEASYIPTLDGWRAVAILSVIFCHGVNQTRFPMAMSLGYLGVSLFFAISGFLITSRMVDEARKSGTIDLGRFYLRRSFRILPPAFVFLGTIVILGAFGVIPFSLSPVLKALLFVRNYTPMNYADKATWYSAHFWSLSVEEHFYLLWPTIFVLAGLKRARWVAPALAIVTILWRMLDEKHDFVARLFHAPFLSGEWGRTDYTADVLLWGCALALWIGQRPWKSFMPRGTTSLACIGLATFNVIAAFYPTTIPHARNFVNLFMALILGLTVLEPNSILSTILEAAPLRVIGRLSYSLYLWQQLFFHADEMPKWFQLFPVNVLLIMLCACLSYYLIERPAIRLGQRLLLKMRTRDAARQNSNEPLKVLA